MKSWLVRHAWQIVTVVILIVYAIFVILFLPIPVSITQTPSLPFNGSQNYPYMKLEENVSNSGNLPYFRAGDLAIFSFNITNAASQSATFDYNSSASFLDYFGQPRHFTLNPYESENFTEEFPLSEGINGFRFQIVRTIGDITGHYDIGPQIIQAISPSYELSFFVSETTLLLTIILGIPAIVYGVKEFRELVRKKTNNE